jgi:hypothetical protein
MTRISERSISGALLNPIPEVAASVRISSFHSPAAGVWATADATQNTATTIPAADKNLRMRTSY